MAKLEQKGLGTVKQVKRSNILYKALPTAVRADQLINYGISIEDYTTTFKAVDQGLTEGQRFTAEVTHPHGEAFDAYQAVQGDNRDFKQLMMTALTTTAVTKENWVEVIVFWREK